MTYTINRTDGSRSIVIPDGTINTETTVTLVGKNYPNYGAVLDRNFLRLLENSANGTPPEAPLSGELWWDSSHKTLKAFTGLNWKSIGSTTTGYNKPPLSSSTTGDLWWDTGVGQLWGYDNNTSDYKLIGPSGGAGGTVSEQILDTLTNTHTVLSMKLNGTSYLILSKDPSFTPNPAIPGFQTINPGLNLANQNFLVGAKFIGQVSDSDKLNGIESVNFMRSDINTNTAGILSVNNNSGIYVGASNQLHLSVVSANVAISSENPGGGINFKVRTSGNADLDAMDIYANGYVSCNYNLDVKGNLSFSNYNSLILSGTTVSTTPTTGIFQSRGGVGIAGNLNVGGATNLFAGQVVCNSLYSNSFITATTLNVTSAANLGVISHVRIDGGTDGDFLKTDGEGNLTWQAISAAGIDITTLLPSQSGNNGKVLTTDGSGVISWEPAVTPTTITAGLPSQTGNDGKFLTTNGSGEINWAAIDIGSFAIVPATNSVLGGVKIGSGISVDINGVISTVNNGTITGAGVSSRIAYFSGTSVLTSNAALSFDGLNLTVDGGIKTTGDITAFYTSDSRLKIGIQPIDNALEKVNSLNGVTFNWNELALGKDTTTREAGVLAQEVNAVLPEAVVLRDNGYYAVNYDKIIPLLIEAIKELKSEVALLKAGK